MWEKLTSEENVSILKGKGDSTTVRRPKSFCKLRDQLPPCGSLIGDGMTELVEKRD